MFFIVGFDRIGCTPVLVQRLLDGADLKTGELQKKKEAKAAAAQAVRRAVDERPSKEPKALGERPLSVNIKKRYGL